MIRLDNVCAGYGDKEVLHGVTVEFQPGKITALIGPNGCGKSTLLKTIVRLVDYTSGEITLEEIGHGEERKSRSMKELTSSERAKQVAYLPQSKKAPDIPALSMVLHGRFAYLNYPRKYSAKDIRIAEEALCWAGLGDSSQEMVSRLSGGMQQKVYIAMALAQNANTILMDEPTTYLDVGHQLKLMKMARRLAREGKAVVMVLHDLSQALRIADQVALMYNGQIIEVGTPEQTYIGGNLQKIFGVEIERVKTKTGWHYLCDTEIDGDAPER